MLDSRRILLVDLNNFARYPSLAVGYLADRIRGSEPWATPWPIDQLLREDERVEMQVLLNRLGYPAGTPDGKLGPATRSAIRDFQTATGTAIDGQPTPDVLDRLRAAAKG